MTALIYLPKRLTASYKTILHALNTPQASLTMTPITTRHWILAKKPTELPKLTEPDATFKLLTKTLPPLQENQVLVKVQYLSNDPAPRTWIDPNTDPDRLYTKPVNEGETMASTAAIAEIVESKSAKLPAGTLVTATTGWSEYAILPAEECMPFPSVPGLTPIDFAGLFGTTGITAYYGLVDIAQTKPTDAVVVSGAAGAVGSAAVQIAKKILSCRKVIGIAGTDAKCRWVESLGADTCLNYKVSSFSDDLREAAAGFVEVFFDNTGGDLLDLMLRLLQKNGRVAACGAMANYNKASPEGIKNWYHVVAMRLQIRGFVVLDAMPSGRWSEIVNALIQGYRDGKLETSREGTTVVDALFEDVPRTWMRLFEGASIGKLLTRLV